MVAARRLDESVRALAEIAFAEDLPDVTSEAIFSPRERLQARLLVKADGVLCGLRFAPMIFAVAGKGARVRALAKDGDRVKTGQIVAEIAGPARLVLAVERTLLNILQHASGVATATAVAVAATAGTKCRVLDTRKTLPGFRCLDKYAVRIGGGVNHRLGLHDAVLIKDNHIDHAGSIEAAIDRVRASRRGKKILPLIVEARTIADVAIAIERRVDRILLDNMPLAAMRRAVKMSGGKIPLEASGGMTPPRIRQVARLGVDFVSVGAITHSAPALDISLDVTIAR